MSAEGSWPCGMELMGHLHIALFLGLCLMLLLFSATKQPLRGRCHQEQYGNTPVDALAPALRRTKKAGNQNTLYQCHIHALGPILTPHRAQKPQGASVSPLCIVSGFRSEAASGEPTSHSSLQKPSSSLFVCRQTGGITKGAAENQQCGKICV